MTPAWEWTDDAEDPCVLCVQWRCERCKSYDWPDCCHWETDWEPYWPDGSVVPHIYRNHHRRCDEMVEAYMEEVRRDPS